MPTAPSLDPYHTGHDWHYRPGSDDYKCLVCGGIAKQIPLDADGGLADRYEALTGEERALAITHRKQRHVCAHCGGTGEKYMPTGKGREKIRVECVGCHGKGCL